MFGYIRRMYRFLGRHPLTRNAPLAGMGRVARWQIASRLLPFDMAMPWIGGTRLMLRRGMTGATGNWYTGLHEPQDMGFILHFLRPDDLFLDVGANIGAYTILASGVAGARTIAVEPGNEALAMLGTNVCLNALVDRVTIAPVGISDRDGTAHFTSGLDTVNHLTEGPRPGTVEIEVRSLDSLVAGRVPVCIKMDVEGAEYDALSGAEGLLAAPGLRALILELNLNIEAAGHTAREIHTLLAGHGFRAYTYDPMTRSLRPPDAATSENVIFVRDEAFVTDRLANAPIFNVLDQRL